ncbi:MAG: hypothetical protein KAR11_03305 [Phycisphaerae bacterium]|nr:hypothetical protein [Phycisphaerae bacterium]
MRELKFLAGPLVLLVLGVVAFGANPELPSTVYVPYDKLQDVIGGKKQGVFLPYDEFQKLWSAAQGKPAPVDRAPVNYLISTARFNGQVGTDLARMEMQLTVDILTDDWVNVPIGLGEVAVEKVSFVADSDAKTPKAQDAKIPCLLRIVKSKYTLLTKGKGRRVLNVKFVRQLVSKPGLHILEFRVPQSAISTLELTIPEENMKVDVAPVLATTTSQVKIDGKTATKLQAFLGATGKVKLSWKPRSQAAANLAPVITCNQLQKIYVDEALIKYDVRFDYDIRRRGVDSFTIQLPGNFRVIGVDGANIANWELTDATGKKIGGGEAKSAALKAARASGVPAGKTLKVKLFSPAKGKYSLAVKMERFLKDDTATVAITPIVTQNVLRRSGLVGLLHSPRRSVELGDAVGLNRVDVGQLPKNIRSGAVAYRFVTANYGGKLNISTVEPRIYVAQNWNLTVSPDEMLLQGILRYDIKRVGVFRVEMSFPEPWKIISVKPAKLVEDYELVGKGADRRLKILLRRESVGGFSLALNARASRSKPTDDVEFVLPRPDAKNLKQYSGRLTLRLDRSLRAEVSQLDQFKAVRFGVMRRQKQKQKTVLNDQAMGFEFRSPDAAKPAGAKFNIAVKSVQISAVAHHLVDVMEGALSQQTLIEYNILYAPVDTLYLKLPAALADAGVEIRGANIKEKPRIEKLPPGQQTKGADGKQDVKWAYYKIVLQSPVIGKYQLRVNSRRSIQFGAQGKKLTIAPVFAAGKISDQSGTVAIAKSDSLAVVNTNFSGMTKADPGSPADLPYAPFRKRASLAFKYNLTLQTPNPFAGSFEVVHQEEAQVVTTMVQLCVVEQTLGKNGMLNARATFFIKTRRGDRFGYTLPRNAKSLGVLINGDTDAAVETGSEPNQQVVRLPSSGGEVSKVTLQVNYSMSDVKSLELAAPRVDESVPVQQTLWRVYLPQQQLVLSTDSDFSALTEYQTDKMVSDVAGAYGGKFKLQQPTEGRGWNFIRQGASKTLKVWTMRSAKFHIIIWVVIVVFGVVMLLIAGFWRCLVVLAGAFGLGIASLFTPQMISQGIAAGWFAALLVVLMWVAHWLFHHFKVESPPKSSPKKPPVSKAPAMLQDDVVNLQGQSGEQE